MSGFDVNRLDDAIHGRLRLGIMAYLADAGAADFNELKGVLEATQGNLSVHLSKLEDAGYVEIIKGYQGKKPLTRVHITPAGRQAFARYIEVLSGLVEKRS
ncbi:transcriptional regulator [Asticcacaulis sp. DW145]|jgi:DNA-binding MarR family transcriptional regulator|uniref:Transcriptional regulator n=1 Tax=Asticcacaulis currens TaxID=2984210 RepID=A0ABT5IIW3_9CAUL|nr:transcriptional regulator [Asticcacaulis currens]MDC7696141.1 transcriptional regulator [Asticcacaulis currens]BEV10891.1 transcriptional regulator [Asticcacaulis sp. DW145]